MLSFLTIKGLFFKKVWLKDTLPGTQLLRRYHHLIESTNRSKVPSWIRYNLSGVTREGRPFTKTLRSEQPFTVVSIKWTKSGWCKFSTYMANFLTKVSFYLPTYTQIFLRAHIWFCEYKFIHNIHHFKHLLLSWSNIFRVLLLERITDNMYIR